MKKQPTDLEQRLRNNDKNALEEVYLLYKEAFLNYASKFNLPKEDVIDIYQDSIIVLFQNFVSKQLSLEKSSIKTYLFGIGKHKIYDRLKEKKILYKTEDIHEADNDIIIFKEDSLTEQQVLLRKKYKQLGERCKSILNMFYYRNLTIKEIVTLTNYKDENTVKSHKSRCMKKLRTLIIGED
jgi:RNA polymerase sigma-70 factor (ECF subfamily)